MGGKQCITRGDAITANEQWRLGARRNQHRFIAHFDRITQRPDLERTTLAPAVATTDHTGRVARNTQLFNQGNDEGCFAATADADVADDNDRHGQSRGTEPAALVPQAPRRA